MLTTNICLCLYLTCSPGRHRSVFDCRSCQRTWTSVPDCPHGSYRSLYIYYHSVWHHLQPIILLVVRPTSLSLHSLAGWPVHVTPVKRRCSSSQSNLKDSVDTLVLKEIQTVGPFQQVKWGLQRAHSYVTETNSPLGLSLVRREIQWDSPQKMTWLQSLCTWSTKRAYTSLVLRLKAVFQFTVYQVTEMKTRLKGSHVGGLRKPLVSQKTNLPDRD